MRHTLFSSLFYSSLFCSLLFCSKWICNKSTKLSSQSANKSWYTIWKALTKKFLSKGRRKGEYPWYLPEPKEFSKRSDKITSGGCVYGIKTIFSVSRWSRELALICFCILNYHYNIDYFYNLSLAQTFCSKFL